LDYSEFSCRWIDKEKLWKVADDVREKYWPEATLPVNTEKIVEFRLKLYIDLNIIYFLKSTWTPI
jgi:hypothetical protein